MPDVWGGPQLEQVSALDRGQPATAPDGSVIWVDPRKLPEPEVTYREMTQAEQLYYTCG